MVDGFLLCEEWGCASGELGRGWVAYQCDDLDVQEPRRSSSTAHPVPPASSATGPDVADDNVRGWLPALL